MGLRQFANTFSDLTLELNSTKTIADADKIILDFFLQVCMEFKYFFYLMPNTYRVVFDIVQCIGDNNTNRSVDRVMMMERRCSLCKHFFNMNKFGSYYDKRRLKRYYFVWCRRCHVIKNVANRRGITYDTAIEMYSRPCEICNFLQFTNTRQQHIDHCHRTGKVRGMLCCSCNQYVKHYELNPSDRDTKTKYAYKYKRYVPSREQIISYINKY